MDTASLPPSSTGIMHMGRGAGTWFYLLSPWILLNRLHRTGRSRERDPRLYRLEAIPSSRWNISEKDLDDNPSEARRCGRFSRSFAAITIHQLGEGSTTLQ